MTRAHLITLLFLAACAKAGDGDYARMMRVEASIIMPPGAPPISAYTRYYSWADASRRKVRAVYELGGKRTRIWLPPEKMIMIMDGGCGVITFTFDMLTEKPDNAACNGDA